MLRNNAVCRQCLGYLWFHVSCNAIQETWRSTRFSALLSLKKCYHFAKVYLFSFTDRDKATNRLKCEYAGADLGGGCKGVRTPLPWDDLRFSNTTGILQKKKNYVVYWCWSKRRVHPLLKKILDPPQVRMKMWSCCALNLCSTLRRNTAWADSEEYVLR